MGKFYGRVGEVFVFYFEGYGVIEFMFLILGELLFNKGVMCIVIREGCFSFFWFMLGYGRKLVGNFFIY